MSSAEQTPAALGQGTRRTNGLASVAVPLVVVGVLVGLALAIGALAVAVTGQSPLVAMRELVQGALGTRTSLAATITRAIPIVLCGIAALVALRAGLLNLGMEGQMITGALAAAWIGTTATGLPAPLLFVVTLLGGCLAGGLFAVPTAWWQTQYKIPVLITTLLLNYIAVWFASYAVNLPLRDTTGSGAIAQTIMVTEAIRLPIIVPGTRLHLGVLALLILPVAVTWFFNRTALGYRARMSGLNPDFARYGGVHTTRVTLFAMFVSGAVAGLAGAIHVLGVDFRYIDNVLVASGSAWTGFIAAILGAPSAYGVVLAGLFLASLEVGAAGMQRNTQIPLQIADVVQAGIIFIVAVRLRIIDWVRRLFGQA